MKQVKEFISFESGFFSIMQSMPRYTELFSELFRDDGATVFSSDIAHNLDMDLVVTCGERYASPLLVHHEMEKVVDYVVARYGEKWKRTKAALMAEYDVVSPYNTKQVTTQEKQTENTTAGTTTDKMGVVAFDSETATDKSVDSTTNEGNTKGSEKVTITVENVGANGNISPAAMIANEIEVRKNSFIGIVIGDVENQLTLDIY